MKSILKAVCLSALLLACACGGATAPANNTTNAAATNAANRPAQTTNAASPAASNTANAAAANASPASSERGGKQDFSLVNSTGVEINKVFISPHDADDWEEDILGRDTLPAGQSVDIKFDRDEQAAMWDLRVEDSQGNSIVWENLDLLKISKLTLHYENGRARAEAE